MDCWLCIDSCVVSVISCHKEMYYSTTSVFLLMSVYMFCCLVDRLEILEYVKLILLTIATALRGNPANVKHFQENVSFSHAVLLLLCTGTV